MTDLKPSSGAAGGELPSPTFFDPSFERIPAAAAYGAAGAGPVLLLFDPGAHREWVADAAIALATEWTRSGRRTVLADLSLEDPVLHERIGMANQDGVVDIFLYGASLARSARPVPGRGFYLISAGTYTNESEDVFRHPRWEKIVAGFREAQASLLLFVPAGAPGASALARWAGEVMLLGSPSHAALFREAAAGLAVQAWLAPPGSEEPASHGAPLLQRPPAAPSARFPEPEPAAVAWPEPATAIRPHPEAPVVVDGNGGGPAHPAAGVPDASRAEPREGKPARRTSPVLVVLLLLVLLGAAAYLLYTQRPDLFGMGASSPAAGEDGAGEKAPAAPPRLAQAPRDAGAALPYAISVSNFTDLKAALREVAKQQSRFPEAQFYVVPEDVQGQLWYKVLAGTVGDTAEAAALRGRLVDAGVIARDQADDEKWALVQTRPLAYSLGEFTTDSAARAAAEGFQRRGIPAYAVPVPFSDGGERWRVYGGAFRDSAAALPMGKLLRDNRVPAMLVDRTGRPPAVPK
jgi:hypothetical protein